MFFIVYGCLEDSKYTKEKRNHQVKERKNSKDQ